MAERDIDRGHENRDGRLVLLGPLGVELPVDHLAGGIARGPRHAQTGQNDEKRSEAHDVFPCLLRKGPVLGSWCEK